MKTVLKGLAIAAVVAAFIFIGLKVNNAYKATKVIGKCFLIESQLTIFAVTGYGQEPQDISGTYVIEGYIFVLPFKAAIPDEEFEQILLVAEEVSCQGPENE